MKKSLVRIVALFTTFVISFSILLVPASAGFSDAVQYGAKTFYTWVNNLSTVSGSGWSLSGWWKSLTSSGSDESSGTAYSDYVSTLPLPSYSGLTDSWIYYPLWTYTSTDDTFITTDYVNTAFEGTVTFPSKWTAGNYFRVYGSTHISVTCNGTYTVHVPVYSSAGSGNTAPTMWMQPKVVYSDGSAYQTAVNVNCSKTTEKTASVEVTDFSSSTPMYFDANVGLESYQPDAGTWSFSSRPFIEFVPSSTVSVDYSTETRTGSLCGDYFYEGDDGTMVQAENIYLFDETNNTVNNPATGTTATASSWTYDYATRTYTITATDGSTYTVVSGDDAAAVTIKDSGNIVTTYNYYYGTTTGSGGNTGGDSESIWDKLGNLFGSITDGFLEVLKAFIGKLLDGLTSLLDLINSKIGNIVNSILSLFDNVPKLFTGFTAFLTAVFPFLPQEFFDILILGAALAAVILIIKMLKK